MTWAAIGSGFLLGIIKFLFAAVYLESVYPELNFIEIALIPAAGALFGFNTTYWLSDVLLNRAKRKRVAAMKSGKFKKKRAFTKMNKFIVRLKMSKSGMYGLSSIGMLLLSIPIGGIVLAKFYREDKRSYLIATLTILFTAFTLALLSKFAFGLFR